MLRPFIPLDLITLTKFGEASLRSKYFSQEPVVYSSPTVRDKVPHQYKTKVKIIVLNILTLKFLEGRREGKGF
jgi:hypothetical protein